MWKLSPLILSAAVVACGPAITGQRREPINPSISSPTTSLGGTQSERVQSGVPLPEGSPYAGTVAMGRSHPARVVKEAQMALRQKGYDPGAIDGSMGNETREALKKFQRDANLDVTGTLNPATAQKLGVDLTP